MPSPPSDATKPPLDSNSYSLDEEQAEFFKSQIGLEGDELKEHILAVQKKAYEVRHLKTKKFPCVLTIPHRCIPMDT